MRLPIQPKTVKPKIKTIARRIQSRLMLASSRLARGFLRWASLTPATVNHPLLDHERFHHSFEKEWVFPGKGLCFLSRFEDGHVAPSVNGPMPRTTPLAMNVSTTALWRGYTAMIASLLAPDGSPMTTAFMRFLQR